MVARLHRTVKAALMAHNSTNWVGKLPFVLLGLTTAHKQDLRASAAELVYGSTLRLPGEMLTSSNNPTQLDAFVVNIRETMAQLQPIETEHHIDERPFVHPALRHSTHVFVRNDKVKTALTKRYEGPYQVIERRDKYFQVLIKNRTSNISIDRLKPAFLDVSEREHTITTGSQPTGQNPTPAPTALPAQRSGQDNQQQPATIGDQNLAPQPINNHSHNENGIPQPAIKRPRGRPRKNITGSTVQPKSILKNTKPVRVEGLDYPTVLQTLENLGGLLWRPST